MGKLKLNTKVFRQLSLFGDVFVPLSRKPKKEKYKILNFRPYKTALARKQSYLRPRKRGAFLYEQPEIPFPKN